MTTSANPSLEFAEGLFKSLVWDIAIKSTLSYIFVAAPYLNAWPLKAVIEYVVKLVSDHVYSGLKFVVDMETIGLLNSAHQKEYDSAFIQLKLLARDKGVDSQEFKDAKEKAKVVLSQFVRFGAAA